MGSKEVRERYMIRGHRAKKRLNMLNKQDLTVNAYVSQICYYIANKLLYEDWEDKTCINGIDIEDLSKEDLNNILFTEQYVEFICQRMYKYRWEALLGYLERFHNFKFKK